ncbi:MAG: OmpH family outer membrane protein [Steroidobacteraceae bacterium]|nr:OmpH family outer membrane protein [Steroidobacteraceae bacterium]
MSLLKSTFVAVAALGALAASPAFAQSKIGVVDYGRLMEESPQAKTALDAIRNEFAPKQKELVTQQQVLKTKEDKLQKDAATMSADQRTRTEKELRDGYRDLERRRQEVQEDFNARRNEEMSRLQRTLIEEVRSYAKAQGYDLVLADGVLYANPSLDITPTVLTNLKSRTAAPAAR